MVTSVRLRDDKATSVGTDSVTLFPKVAIFVAIATLATHNVAVYTNFGTQAIRGELEGMREVPI